MLRLGGSEGGPPKSPEIGNLRFFAEQEQRTKELIVKDGGERLKQYAEEFGDRRQEINSLVEGTEAHEAVSKLITQWEEQHTGSEYIQTEQVGRRVEFLLALLVECGSDWSPQKRRDMRRFIYGYFEEAVGVMRDRQVAGIFQDQILKTNYKQALGELSHVEKAKIGDLVQSSFR